MIQKQSSVVYNVNFLYLNSNELVLKSRGHLNSKCDLTLLLRIQVFLLFLR